MAETTYKPGAIAKTLGVSGVTVRNYVHHFAEFLSPSATNATNRQFTDDDVKVLRLAHSRLRDGFTYNQVREQLSERPIEGEVFEGTPGVEPAGAAQEPAPDTNSIQPVEFFLKFTEQLREEHRNTLQAQQETIQELKNDKERLQKEIDFLRQPFFVRWFRKP